MQSVTPLSASRFTSAFGAILLPDDWQDALQYLPSNAAAAFTSLTASSSTLAVPEGVLVFATWVVVLAAAAAAPRHRGEAPERSRRARAERSHP